MAHHHNKSVLIRSKFDGKYEILGNKCFDTYTEAKKWCEENYPELSKNLDENFSIRSYTHRAMSREIIKLITDKMESGDLKSLVLSLARHAYPDDDSFYEEEDKKETRKEIVKW